MNTDDYTQPLEAVMRQERQRVYSMPLKVSDRRYLFKEWCEKNPQAIRESSLRLSQSTRAAFACQPSTHREAALRGAREA